MHRIIIYICGAALAVPAATLICGAALAVPATTLIFIVGLTYAMGLAALPMAGRAEQYII